jgi:serine/threonine protein kinase
LLYGLATGLVEALTAINAAGVIHRELKPANVPLTQEGREHVPYFTKPSYWRNHGKLDVPKERFISYPNASPDSDKSTLLGWADWDYREQALALYALIDERQNVDGWDANRVKPLVQGLTEVMPWVRQWHNEVEPAFGQSVADVLGGYLAAQKARYGITD